MLMSESPLSKQAGPIAVIAGGLFAVTHVGQFLFFDPTNLVAMVADPVMQFFSVAYFLAFPLLLVALVALYGRQADRAGLFGAVAFCTALLGTVALAGDMWFEAFAVPWIMPQAPQLAPAEPGSLLWAGWLVSVVLFALGWALFGLVSIRTRAFPRGLSVAVTVGGLLGYFAAQPPWGLALGLAVAAVGVWLVRRDRTAHASPVESAAEPVAFAEPR
jgi:hypothetical protein